MNKVTVPLQAPCVLRSPRVREELTPADWFRAAMRHIAGDWGEVSTVQQRENQQNLAAGSGRLLSAYRTGTGEMFWVMSEGDWSDIAVFFPEEFEEYRRVRASLDRIEAAVQ